MKFDDTLNWSTIISAIVFIGTIVGFGWSIKSGQKVQSVQYAALSKDLDDVKSQLGELRRLQFMTAARSDVHDKTIKDIVKATKDNKKQIPKLLSNIENLKKQVETQIPK
jgi:seryl-tRNA synthetase